MGFMERFKVVFIRVILLIMILSLNNGCGNNMPQKNDQVENVLQEEMDTCSNCFVLKPQDYEILSNEETSYTVKLRDSAISRLREKPIPVLKIEFKDGTKIAKGIHILAAAVPEGCDLFYCYGDDERIVLWGGTALHLIKTQHGGR